MCVCVCLCVVVFFCIIPSNSWLTEFPLDVLMLHGASTQRTQLSHNERPIMAGWKRQMLTVDRISDVDTG